MHGDTPHCEAKMQRPKALLELLTDLFLHRVLSSSTTLTYRHDLHELL